MNYDFTKSFFNTKKPCKFFTKGEECPLGESCAFLHRRDSNAASDAIHVVPTNDPPTESERSNKGKHSNVAQTRKRKICYSWKINGHCRYGVNCHFSHRSSGESELRKSATMEKKQIGEGEETVMQKPNRLNTDSKWGGPDKISSVYADWIDDIQ